MEIAVHQDKIIGTFNRIASREKDRASDAGEDREEIGNLLELTGLHKKAVSFCRMLHKQEPEKREDILRSLHPLLSMMEAHWDGQSTPDMFAEGVEPGDDEPGEEEGDEFEDTEDEGEGDEELQADADDFDAHLAEVSG